MTPLLTLLAALVLPLTSTAATTFTNPVIWQDHPDVDVFRVNDTYYYSSSTFAYSPGAPVLRSYDLANWEPVSHSVPRLNFGANYDLTNNNRAYVKGIWASTLRYSAKRDRFYWLGCVDGRTYVWIHNGLNKEWNWQAKGTVSGAGCYYDVGMLVDDETGDIFTVYGNKEIRVAQLSDDGSGNLRETKNQVVYNSASDTVEGSRLYKIKGQYFVFLTRPADSEFVLRSTTNVWGPYTRRAFVERISGPLTNAGFAHQGGVVDTQDGRWYYMAFLDAYPGGRIPVLAPMTWTSDGWPQVVVDQGTKGWGKQYPIPVNTTKTVKGMVGGVEEFKGGKLGEAWEWNHNPDDTKWALDPSGGGLVLKTATVTGDLFAARNTLTHRIVGPKSTGTFKIDVSGMKDGDRAGAVLFRDQAGYIGIHKTGNTASIVVVNSLNLAEGTWSTSSTGKVAATGPSLTGGEVWFRIQADITPAFGTNTGRQAVLSYSLDGKTFTSLGPALTLSNSWRYFTGYRYGVFNFATKSLGGEVRVKSFSMELV
ncbi:putative beta-xylosidase [Cladorrhinum sp. PSN259]|nr:putative beta-xylosidase [Cladorrhinum sp. PSN259]